MFEKKDEVRIKPEFIDLYEEMGLRNFYNSSPTENVSICKLGRVIVLQDNLAQVDFWTSTPSRYTIKTDHLELVTKASERPDVAGEPMGAVLSEQDKEDLLYKEGVITEEEYMEILVKRDMEQKRRYIERAAMDKADEAFSTKGTQPIEVNWEDSIKEAVSELAPKKLDQGKPRMDLVRPEFTLALGQALAYGADKYDEKIGELPNYLKGDGFNYSRIIGSLERHIAQWKMGIDVDEESGQSHLALAAANIMFLLTYEQSEKGIDDRVKL